MKQHRVSQASQGFTLIELLVVISIIMLLMAVLMPALSKSRQAGQSALCLNNLRQMGIANFAYNEMYKHMVSGADFGGSSGSRWFNALDIVMTGKDYVAPNRNQLPRPAWQLCPTRAAPLTRNSIGYGWNYINFGHEYSYANPASSDYDPGPPFGRGWNTKVEFVKRPSHTVFIADSTDDELAGVAAPDSISSGDRSVYRLYHVAGLNPSTINSRWARRHAGAGNWLYIDGHAKGYTPEAFAQVNASTGSQFHHHR